MPTAISGLFLVVTPGAVPPTRIGASRVSLAMGQQQRGKGTARDRVVCFCYNVPESVIVEAIGRGCSSLMDIRRETYASTGCAGCSEEVKKLLRKHAARASREETPAGPEGGGDE